MRLRLRKKRHREFLTTVCGYVVTFDDELRNHLLQSEPGTPYRVDGSCSPGTDRLIRRQSLRYWVMLSRKVAPATAMLVFWAEEFPSVREEAVIFSLIDLRIVSQGEGFS